MVSSKVELHLEVRELKDVGKSLMSISSIPNGPFQFEVMIDGQTQHTEQGTWRGPCKSQTLSWQFEEKEMMKLKAYNPKFKISIHTPEEKEVAWCMLDLRDMSAGSLIDTQWIKLQGGAGGELRLSGGIRFISSLPSPDRLPAATTPGRSAGSKTTTANDLIRRLTAGVGAAVLSSSSQNTDDDQQDEADYQGALEAHAFPIGSGSDLFLLTVEITGWGGDGRGLLLPGPAAGGMWLSYMLFESVACTDRFYELGKGRHRKSTDIFRLKSYATGADLATWFSNESRRCLQVFLCTAQRFIAIARLDLWALLLGGHPPEEMQEKLFPHEAVGRFEMETWEDDGSQGIKGGAWVDMRFSLEREDESNLIGGDGEKEERGIGTLIPMNIEAAREADAPKIHTPGQEVHTDAEMALLLAAQQQQQMGRGGEQQAAAGGEVDGGGLAEEEEERYSDDFLPEGDQQQQQQQASQGAATAEQEVIHLDIGVHPPPEGQEEKEDDEEEDEEEEEEELGFAQHPQEETSSPSHHEGGDGQQHPSQQQIPRPMTKHQPATYARPTGLRSFRLSIDLRSLRDLHHAQHIFLVYHYPYLSDQTGPSLLDNPVLSSPVWVPARMETPMLRCCCSFSFAATYDSLERVSTDHPFVVSVRAKEAGGTGLEIGKAGVPFEDLLHKIPLSYRCPVRPRLFKSYTRCQRFIDRLAAQNEAPSGAVPIILRVIDTYVPVIGKEGVSSDTGLLPSLRCVLVLEDLGPAEKGVAAVAPLSSKQGAADEAVAVDGISTSLPLASQQGSSANPSNVSAALRLLEIERKKLEFEDWRHKRELEWVDRLRAKEASRMEELERIFAEKEKERKALFLKAQEDFGRLESKLRRSLSEIESRERRLSAFEEELKGEAIKKTQEVQALQRRLREEAKYQLDLDRLRTKELEDREKRLRKELQVLEAKFTEVQDEYSRYRKEQSKRTAPALHAEIAKVKGEKAELESRWERERAEKNKALLEKEQYRGALQRTARALKREQNKQVLNLRQELEQLKIEYVAREERFRLDGERDELHKIKKTLDALRHLSLSVNNVGSTTTNAAANSISGVGIGGGGSSSVGFPIPPPSRGVVGGGDLSPENKENLSTTGGFPSHWLASSSGGGGKDLSMLGGDRGGERIDAAHLLMSTPERRSLSLDREEEEQQPSMYNEQEGGEEAGEEEGVRRSLVGQDPQLDRLRHERDDLMSSGVYSQTDPIIRKLTLLIAEKEESLR